MNKYMIGIYLRLSQEDGGSLESNSIINQRSLIINYIRKDSELCKCPVTVFLDDGYTGTNFERPAMKQLLEQVKTGEINCIIVKDLSRFGRQYLQVSRFIEQIFPYLGVRFIAINDGYDSDNHKGTTAELDVPVRNMLNAMYSKDISKKVKTAKKTKMLEGEIISAQVIYGYEKAKTDKGKLTIDYNAAKVVKQIFELAIGGYTTRSIAEVLNKNGILTPALYKEHLREWNSKTDKNLWTRAAVLRILRDVRYTGTYVSGMWNRSKIGDKSVNRVSKEDWIVIPNAYDEIVSKDAFEKANSLIEVHTKSNTKNGDRRILFNKVKCSACQHNMWYKKANKPYYFCETAKYTHEHNCFTERLLEEELLDIIMVTIQAQLMLIIDLEKAYNENQAQKSKDKGNSSKVLSSMEKEMNLIKESKRALYEAYKQGKYNKTEYMAKREEIENVLEKKETKFETLHCEAIQQSKEGNSVIRFFEKFKAFDINAKPTRELVDSLIDTVYIEPDGSVSIEFSFKDEYESILGNLKRLT